MATQLTNAWNAYFNRELETQEDGNLKTIGPRRNLANPENFINDRSVGHIKHRKKDKRSNLKRFICNFQIFYWRRKGTYGYQYK